MRYLFFIFLFVHNYSFSCNIDNKQFNFNYSLNISNKTLSYEIFRKDGKDFSYFISGKSKSYSHGFIIVTKEIKVSNNKESITHRYKDFYLAKGYYSLANLDNSGFISLPNNNINVSSFIKTSLIHGTLNYEEFIKNIQKNSLKPLAFHNNKIRFQFRYILNNDITECIKFETDDILYDFGGMFENIRLLENDKR